MENNQLRKGWVGFCLPLFPVSEREMIFGWKSAWQEVWLSKGKPLLRADRLGLPRKEEASCVHPFVPPLWNWQWSQLPASQEAFHQAHLLQVFSVWTYGLLLVTSYELPDAHLLFLYFPFALPNSKLMLLMGDKRLRGKWRKNVRISSLKTTGSSALVCKGRSKLNANTWPV